MSNSFSFSVSDDLSGTFAIYTNANVLDRPEPQTICDLFLDNLEVVGERIDGAAAHLAAGRRVIGKGAQLGNPHRACCRPWCRADGGAARCQRLAASRAIVRR